MLYSGGLFRLIGLLVFTLASFSHCKDLKIEFRNSGLDVVKDEWRREYIIYNYATVMGESIQNNKRSNTGT